MAYSQALARRIRILLSEQSGWTEKVMFGGIGFLLHGNMAVGVHHDSLIVRVGAQNYEHALQERFVRPFDMTGRPMTGWVEVNAQGCASDAQLRSWVQRGVSFVEGLPAK